MKILGRLLLRLQQLILRARKNTELHCPKLKHNARNVSFFNLIPEELGKMWPERLGECESALGKIRSLLRGSNWG